MTNKNEEEDETQPEKTPDYGFIDSLNIDPLNPSVPIEKRIEEKLIEEEERRKQEVDVHILDIQKIPPIPDYMAVSLFRGEFKDHTRPADSNITQSVVVLPLEKKIEEIKKTDFPNDKSVYVNVDGDQVKIFDSIFDIDLKTMFEGQVSDCASTIFPMLMDEYVGNALAEKKAWTPEKRKEEFKWWWVLILAMIIIPLILIITTVLPGLIG